RESRRRSSGSPSAWDPPRLASSTPSRTRRDGRRTSRARSPPLSWRRRPSSSQSRRPSRRPTSWLPSSPSRPGYGGIMSLVEEAVRNWENFRNGVIAEIENSPEEQLDYRPGEGARTLREVALHIAYFSVGMVNEILRPDGSILNVFKPEVQAEIKAGLPRAHSKAELVALLRQTGEANAARLRAAGD